MIIETCDIWDTDYNSDNWEPELLTTFVTSQLRVTLDSIRNSCNVSSMSASHIGKNMILMLPLWSMYLQQFWPWKGTWIQRVEYWSKTNECVCSWEKWWVFVCVSGWLDVWPNVCCPSRCFHDLRSVRRWDQGLHRPAGLDLLCINLWKQIRETVKWGEEFKMF